MRKTSPRLDKTADKRRRARTSRTTLMKEMTMNAKLLFAATVAVSALATFASTTVLADEVNAPLTRAQVTAQLDQARADGTLQKTDYDVPSRAQGTPLTRADVLATLAVKPSPLLANSSDRSRSYNPFGIEMIRASTVTRACYQPERRVRGLRVAWFRCGSRPVLPAVGAARSGARL